MFAINDIVSVINDYRAETIGGITIAWKLWESCVVSLLLNSSETWIGMNKESINLLNELQEKITLIEFRAQPQTS